MAPIDEDRSHKRHKSKHKKSKSKSRKDDPREQDRADRGRNREPGSETESGEIPCGSPGEAPQSKNDDRSVDTDAPLADRDIKDTTGSARQSIGCEKVARSMFQNHDHIIDCFCRRDGNEGEKHKHHPSCVETKKRGEGDVDMVRDRSEPSSHHRGRHEERRVSAGENGTDKTESTRSIGEDEARRSHRSRSRERSGKPSGSSRREEEHEGRGRDKVSSEQRNPSEREDGRMEDARPSSRPSSSRDERHERDRRDADDRDAGRGRGAEDRGMRSGSYVRGERERGRDLDDHGRGRVEDRRGDVRDRERERDRGERERERGYRGGTGSRHGDGHKRSPSRDRGGSDRRHKYPRHDEPRRRRSEEPRGGSDTPELPDEVAEKLLKFGMEDEVDEEQRLIEERRKRLQEIKARHQQQMAVADSIINPTAASLAAAKGAPGGDASEAPSATPAATVHPDEDDEEDDVTMAAAGDGGEDVEVDSDGGGGSEDDGDVEAGPVMDIFVDADAAEVEGGEAGGAAGGGPGAPSVPVSAVPQSTGLGTELQHQVSLKAAAAAAKKVVDDDEDDMFASEDPEEDKSRAGVAAAAGPGLGGSAAAGEAAAAPAAVAALADAYDDHEGYYVFQVGEMMDSRYEVFASNGKGVFSTVVRARDTARRDEHGKHPEVAIKLIRSNETMFKAAQTEVAVLKLLGQTDPENHKNIIRMLRHFEYRNHMCLVFEPMMAPPFLVQEMNLRDLTKKYGRNKGIDIKAVQLFTSQLIVGLRHLKKNRVLHADIKPDNILINHRHNKVKICDFGSAMMAGPGTENDITPYLVSRFYRAPEVILGLKYEYGMDMWSIGCVVYELFTGRILFPGRDNNEMLKVMMEVKGPFTKKMLRRGAFVDKHFENDQNMSFALMEDDPITKTKVRRLIANPAVKHSFSQLLQRGGANKDSKDRVLVAQLADLLEKMMNLEPEKRIDPEAAMKHPFLAPLLTKRAKA